jgi:hypothetical protein
MTTFNDIFDVFIPSRQDCVTNKDISSSFGNIHDHCGPFKSGRCGFEDMELHSSSQQYFRAEFETDQEISPYFEFERLTQSSALHVPHIHWLDPQYHLEITTQLDSQFVGTFSYSHFLIQNDYLGPPSAQPSTSDDIHQWAVPRNTTRYIDDLGHQHCETQLAGSPWEYDFTFTGDFKLHLKSPTILVPHLADDCLMGAMTFAAESLNYGLISLVLVKYDSAMDVGPLTAGRV